MNLQRAILHILSSAPKAIPAPAIAGMLPAYGCDAALTDIAAACVEMEKAGEVKGTENKDFGMMWKETDDGRLRIA